LTGVIELEARDAFAGRGEGGLGELAKLPAIDKGPEEIAARFGTTAKIVAQRLKLAVVSPKLIALYRDRFYEIQERIAGLSEGEETWPDAAKANAGAVIE